MANFFLSMEWIPMGEIKLESQTTIMLNYLKERIVINCVLLL